MFDLKTDESSVCAMKFILNWPLTTSLLGLCKSSYLLQVWQANHQNYGGIWFPFWMRLIEMIHCIRLWEWMLIICLMDQSESSSSVNIAAIVCAEIIGHYSLIIRLDQEPWSDALLTFTFAITCNHARLVTQILFFCEYIVKSWKSELEITSLPMLNAPLSYFSLSFTFVSLW